MRLISVAFAALVCCQPANAETYSMTLTGASPDGLWSLLAVGIDAAVKEAYPGSSISYQTSGGGFANIALVTSGQAQLGIVHDAELKVAIDGGSPFREPQTSLRALAYLYTWAPVHIIVTRKFAEKYGIASLEDIEAAKAPLRVAVNRRGNITGRVSEELFRAVGITFDDIKDWGGTVVYAGSREQTNLMLNRRIDMIANSLFVGHRALRQITDDRDVIFLPIPRSAIEIVGNRLGTAAYTIPENSYRNQLDAIDTVALGAVLVASRSMDEISAYNLTKALADNVDKIHAVHAAMKKLSPELMASQNVIPFHPGAERYYRDAGLMN